MRPFFNNVIPRTGMPRFPETSTLISRRDSDVISRSHYKHNDSIFNLSSVYSAIRQLQSHVNRLRVRSSAQNQSQGLIFRGEYDPTGTYATNDVVVISGGANAGSFVCILTNNAQTPQLPDTGNLFWVSLSGNVSVLGNWMT